MPDMNEGESVDPQESFLGDLAQGAATGATTGSVAGPWGALVGAIAGAGISAVNSATQPRPAAAAPPRRAPPPSPPPHAAPPPAQVQPSPAPAAPPPRIVPPVVTASPASPGTSPAPSDGGDLAALMPTILRLAQALAAQMTTTPPPAEAIDDESLPRYQAPPDRAEMFSRPIHPWRVDLGEAVWDHESNGESSGTTCAWELQ